MTTTKTIKKTLVWACVVVIAMLLLAAGVWGGMYYANNVQIDSIISIDVNPSIEITANKQDTVLEVKAVNADARTVLDGMELKGTNLQTAVNAIIGSMLRQGYLADGGEDAILVTVQNGNPDKAQELQSMIDTSLQSSSVNIPVTNETIENNSEVQALADEYQISLGKAAYILELAAGNPSLDISKLTGMSIQELNALKNGGTAAPEQPQQDNTTSSAPSSSEPAATTPPVSSAPQTTQPPANTNQPNDNISVDAAKQIALKHAGLSADKVTFIKAHLDYDDGVRIYDIEFYSGNTEYDYEINAQTGAIHSMDWDVENYTIPATGNTGGNVVKNNSGASISAERAKQIALEHAGVSASAVSYIKAELDYEHGRHIYEIEFREGHMEYSYEIDANSGTVLQYERDWDD